MTIAAVEANGARPVVMVTRTKRVRRGSPCVFSNEIEMSNAGKAIPPGSVVRLQEQMDRPSPTPLRAADSRASPSAGSERSTPTTSRAPALAARIPNPPK